MTATFTLQIDSKKGMDTRLFFPGLQAIQPDAANILGNLGAYFFVSGGQDYYIAAAGTFTHPTVYSQDLAGYVQSMTLRHAVDKPLLMDISISLDSASDGNNGAPINSFMSLTPDSLLNPTASTTAVQFNVLGGAGDDKIFGSDYNDFLSGARGRDRLTGYGGEDTFFFANAGSKDRDVVVDFTHNVDRIRLDDTIFVELQDEKLSKAFHDITGKGMKSEQMDDRLLYDRASGTLYYDHDGAKRHGDAPQVIAVFDNHAHIGTGDFDLSF